MQGVDCISVHEVSFTNTYGHTDTEVHEPNYLWLNHQHPIEEHGRVM